MKMYIVYARTKDGKQTVSCDGLKTLEAVNREIQYLRTKQGIDKSTIDYEAYDSETYEFLEK